MHLLNERLQLLRRLADKERPPFLLWHRGKAAHPDKLLTFDFAFFLEELQNPEASGKSRWGCIPHWQLNLAMSSLWYWFRDTNSGRVRELWGLPPWFQKAAEARQHQSGKTWEALRGHCMNVEKWILGFRKDLKMFEMPKPWDTCLPRVETTPETSVCCRQQKCWGSAI